MTIAPLQVSRPIFIIGVGRSGSSIFHQIFSHHPQVAWLSRLSEQYPDLAWPNRLLMSAINYPALTHLGHPLCRPRRSLSLVGSSVSGLQSTLPGPHRR